MANSNKNIFNITDEINWPYVVKKEARGSDNADFGEVQEIVLHYILTEKGIINKETFYLPTELVEEFDGEKLRFSISEQDANEKFKRDSPPSAEEYTIYKKKVNIDKREEKDDNDKDITISLNPSIAQLKEKEDENHNDKIKRQQERQKDTMESLSLQNKTSILKNNEEIKGSFEEKEITEKARQEVEDKARLEAEKKAQSIAQQIQDKAKMDAERKAQSIIQQAEDKARAEAERRSREITQQAEDKSKEIQTEVEQRRRMKVEENIALNQPDIKTMDNNHTQEIKPIEKDIYNDNNSIFNPFEIGITM